MISNINERLLYAIQNYFYTRNQELFAFTFVEPKAKKIQKAVEMTPKRGRSRNLTQHKQNSGIRGARKRQEVYDQSSVEAAHQKLKSSPLVTAPQYFA